MEKINLSDFRKQNENAKNTLSELCKNPQSFTMHIPADEERDTDLIIAKALRNADTMINKIELLLASCTDQIPKLEAFKQPVTTYKINRSDFINNGYLDIIIDATKRIIALIVSPDDFTFTEENVTVISDEVIEENKLYIKTADGNTLHLDE